MIGSHFKKLERMYLSANVNRHMYETTSISISDGRAEIELTLSEKYFHALGAIHGSVYFKLLDDAAFFAVNSMVRDYFVLTTSFNINLTRPVSKGKICAVGEITSNTDDYYLASSILYNEQGKEIADGVGNFVKSRTPLTEKIGYK